MSLIVQKFGGTSVGTPDRIRQVAKRIEAVHRSGHSLVVVVSAMGHTTDELIQLAHQVSEEPPHREMDMLLTAGERISMALLSMALSDLGVPAKSFTGSQSGIITDGSHRRARIRRILGDRLRAAVQEGFVAIVAGFQGVSEEKEITTLGRGGSDTSAVALAAALKAERCEIFTDVDGVYSADPRIVPQARLWASISHDLMLELAVRGAGVLHPRSVELAKRFQVRLCVRNSLNESEGTWVNQEHMENSRVMGVTADPQKMLVEVWLSRPSVMGAVLDRATELHLGMVAPCFAEGVLRFFAEREGEAEWRKSLTELTSQGFLTRFDLQKEIVPLSIVGDRFAQDGGTLSRMIEVLARSNISVTMGSASALAITVAVPAAKSADGVRALHEALIR